MKTTICEKCNKVCWNDEYGNPAGCLCQAIREFEETNSFATTTDDYGREVLRFGWRLAIIDKMGDHWHVYVCYEAPDGNRDGAPWFKGFSTCGQDYKTYKGARKAAEKFLNRK